MGSSYCVIARKECWAYPRHPISMRFLPDSACKIPRKDSFLSELEVLYQLTNQCPKTSAEIERMRGISYALAVGSLMYAMLCTRPDICFVVGMVSRYQSNPGEEHWIAVKHIFKYLRRTRDYMLFHHNESLEPVGYTNSDFQSDIDSRKSTSGYVFMLGL